MSRSLRWRRWLQFRLRTLLGFMLAVAVVVWWFFSPRPEVQKFADGSQMRAVQLRPTRHGWFEARDRWGKVRCTGSYRDGVPVGRWTYFHGNGRRAFEGSCQNGIPVGTWTAWFPDGRKQVELAYGAPLRSFPPKSESGDRAVLEGPIRLWWESGRDRSSGMHILNARQGDWTFSSPDGSTTRRVAFAGGRRTSSRDEERFDSLLAEARNGTRALDEVVNDLSELDDTALPRLVSALRSDDAPTRHLAAVVLSVIVQRESRHSDRGRRVLMIFQVVAEHSDPYVRQIAKLQIARASIE